MVGGHQRRLRGRSDAEAVAPAPIYLTMSPYEVLEVQSGQDMNLTTEERVDHLMVRGWGFLSTSEALQHFAELASSLARMPGR